MRAVHQRLRDALALARDADGRDLLVYCHGFCVALSAHHVGEDRVLFPAIARKHPELGEVLRKLMQDHSMIAHLIGGLQAAVDASGSPAELERHLEGIAAAMESHFRYEERQLLTVLEGLGLEADVGRVFGPL